MLLNFFLEIKWNPHNFIFDKRNNGIFLIFKSTNFNLNEKVIEFNNICVIIYDNE